MANGNPGINKLARVLQTRMQDASSMPDTLDFGSIQGDYSLKTNQFPLPIPAADYLVCRCVTWGAQGATLAQSKSGDGTHPHGQSGVHSGHESGTGAHTHPATEGAHIHDVVVPEAMRGLRPGDRVLVAWVGNDAVVVDLILPATVLGG